MLEQGQLKALVQGKPASKSTLFALIRGVDLITTIPSWLGAYQKVYDQTKDEAAAIEYADSVVRMTQPTGSVQSLSQIMRGNEFQKFWTMFMSHFANMHNLMVQAMDELQYSKDAPARKIGNFARSMMWLWLVPALLTTGVRSGGDFSDWKKLLSNIATYPFAGMLLVRDFMNLLVTGFGGGVASPATGGASEAKYALQSKDPQKKISHGVKALGIATGKLPVQVAVTLDGLIDMAQGETTDFRRLFYSEFALENQSKKTGATNEARKTEF